ncbi:MFS transporter [Spongiactinospora gelatinilytica]|uniref:MFS transporter n=1 Tax=Spongiactinospora gelatinilytica TaxID=2666298 RepID=A0A2W2F4W0_9ACTN|nr:MFS transporter [Spongiactinospora gelatinilytica]PZG23235.1 MFS transporter [Spongiactinospora gelatinilytica]
MSHLTLLRRRPVLVLWLAETLSVFGDRFFTLALTWTAWQRSGAVAMGLVVVVEYVPHILIGMFGRRLIARFSSFRALAGVEVAQIAVVGAMPWLWDGIGLAGVLTVLALIGTADAITNPSLSALVPDLVPAGQVRDLVRLMDLTKRLTWVLGPGSAAVLLVWLPAEHLFLADAATFVVSGAAFAWLSARFRHRAAAPEHAPPQDAPARARAVLRAHPRLACALSMESVGEFCATVATIGLPIWLTAHLHAGPAAYGLVLTAMGAGSLAGNVLSAWRPLASFPAGFCLIWVARGVLLAAYAACGQVWQVVAVTALAAVVTPVTTIGLSAEISRLPGPARLRLFAIEATGLHAAGMGGMLALPVLIEAAPAAAFTAAGAVTAVAGLAALAGSRLLARREADVAISGTARS